MTIPTLSRGEVLKVSKALRSVGKKLPRVGYCALFIKSPGSNERIIKWPDRYVREVCHDFKGYYFVRGVTALDGHSRRKRRRR